MVGFLGGGATMMRQAGHRARTRRPGVVRTLAAALSTRPANVKPFHSPTLKQKCTILMWKAASRARIWPVRAVPAGAAAADLAAPTPVASAGGARKGPYRILVGNQPNPRGSVSTRLCRVRTLTRRHLRCSRAANSMSARGAAHLDAPCLRLPICSAKLCRHVAGQARFLRRNRAWRAVFPCPFRTAK